jgi:hypothetical protein
MNQPVINKTELPIEIWYNILEFIDDIDLLNLSKVNPAFQTLTADPIVWKKLRIQIHIPRLCNLLGKDKRQDLVKSSLSKRYGSRFFLSRQMSSSYIDPNSLFSLEAQKSLNRKITSLKIDSFLKVALSERECITLKG